MTLLLVGDSLTNQNLYYKTRFLAGDSFVYVENEQRRAMVITPFEVQRARKESAVPEVLSFDEFGYWDLVRELGDRSKAWTETVARVAREFGGEVKIEGNFPVYLADALRGGGIRLEIDPNLFIEQRRQKSREEIEAIAEAQQAGQKSMAQAFDILRQADVHLGVLHYNGIPLTAERLRTEIELSLTRDGFEPHGPIVAPGPGAADPHWNGSGPIGSGEAIIFDIFPRSGTTRYFGDCTRTVVRGEPRDELVAMHAAVLRAQE